MAVKPAIDVVLPVVTVPSGFTVFVFPSGLTGLTAESPNDDRSEIAELVIGQIFVRQFDE